MKKSWVNRFLTVTERVGNALPHPASIFAILAAVVVLASWIVSYFDVSITHPTTGEIIEPVSLVNKVGLHRILMEMVHNFTSFAPLGTVLVAMLGIGIAEGSGLISTGLRLVIIKAPIRLLTAVVVFCGVMSNMASDVGYVILIPLGAMVFMAVGRNPLAGMAAAFAGVSGGFSANLLLGTVDPLLQGLTQEGAQLLDPNYEVDVTCNYYFMFASAFLITGLGTWVTEKIVVPQLGEYTGDAPREEVREISKDERRGLRYSLWATITLVLIILWGILPFHIPVLDFTVGVPGDGWLRNIETGSLFKSPFLKGIVSFIFIGGATAGIAFGIGAKTFKSDHDVMDAMTKTMKTLGIFFVLVFFAAQFVEYFKWTNLGTIIAVKGATGLKAFVDMVGVENRELKAILVMVPFIIVAAVINLVMGSASAKWALMAPVFVPMFMILGYTPEFTQLVYRIGDSVTNIISPLMTYFALIIAFMAQYDKKAGIGTLISMMLPYSFIFFIAWTIFLIIWIFLGWPIGPGVDMYLN